MPATIQLGAPGEATRDVARVGTVHEQAGVTVEACSVLNDRVVVVQMGGGPFATAVWVVQLSTGRVIWNRSYSNDGSTLLSIRASRDGQYVTESSGRLGQGGPPPVTTVVRGAGGAVLAQLDGTVEAFSWDGSLAVVLGNPADNDRPIRVVRWRDGTVAWTVPHGTVPMVAPTAGAEEVGRNLLDAFPEPGGQRIAIVLESLAPRFDRSTQSVDIYTVGPDGRTALLVEDARRS
jgi:hypothetical protein